MKKLLFVFELHGSTDVVEFFRKNISMFHEMGYRNIGYELNQNEAERVLNSEQTIVGLDGKPSPRQAINDIFMRQNPSAIITGLDIPELNDVNRFILNLYLSYLFEKIHCVRDHNIFHQARRSSEKSRFGSVNLVGCNHVGIMHQLIAYAVRENQLDFLSQCKFVFLVETGYRNPPHLFGTELQAYPLDALFIDTKKGLVGTEEGLREYLERPVKIPDASLLSRVQREVDDLTAQQTQFYNLYCRKLFQVFNAGEKHGIRIEAIMYAREIYRDIISELANLTLEAVNNGGSIFFPVSKVSRAVVSMLTEVGFKFSSLNQAAKDAYFDKQFERAVELFERCLKESKNPKETDTIKYNLASACREAGKIEKSLTFFYEAILIADEAFRKESSQDGSKLCKYMNRYFDVLEAHPSLWSDFELQTKKIEGIYQQANLKEEALLTKMRVVIGQSKGEVCSF